MQYRENYCRDRSLTQAQYERECFQARLTNSLKPYPEMINPTLPKQEREEIKQGYKEQQEHTHTRSREREEPNR